MHYAVMNVIIYGKTNVTLCYVTLNVLPPLKDDTT